MAEEKKANDVLILKKVNLRNGLRITDFCSIDNLENPELKPLFEIETDDYATNSLFVYDGKLCTLRFKPECKGYHLLSEEEQDFHIYDLINRRIVCKLPKKIENLCSHDGKLYGTRRSGGVSSLVDALENRVVVETERRFGIKVLRSHGGKLYDASDNQIFETLSGAKAAEFGKPIEFVDDIVTMAIGTEILDLCSHNGELFCSVTNQCVSSICCVSRGNEIIAMKGNLTKKGDYDASSSRAFDQLFSHDGMLLAVANNRLYSIDTASGPATEVLGARREYQEISYLSGLTISKRKNRGVTNLAELFKIDTECYQISSVPRSAVE